LLSQQRVFGQEFSLAAGEISNGAQKQRSMCRLGPIVDVLANTLSATVSEVFNQGEERKHSTRNSLSAKR
jgi:hypothetical protein